MSLRPYKIKNTALRRISLVVGLPVVLLVVAPLAPFIVLKHALEDGFSAFMDSISDDWNSSAWRLIRIGFWWGWQSDFHTDKDASLKRAQEIVNNNETR